MTDVTDTSPDVDSGGTGPRRHRLNLVEGMTFEIVPTKSVDGAIAALPPASEVSVTCSPIKGIAETMRLTDQVRNLGHTAIPHLAARMVEGPEHVALLAKWLRTEAIGRLFLVGGDADPPLGPYGDAATFLRDLLEADPGLHVVGVTAYPEGHPAIPTEALSNALHAKQAILDEAGIGAYASTQMCFDPDRIAGWLGNERLDGLTMPIHLGVAGAVDRTKLMSMGMRLGVSTSLSFLKKNRKAMGRLLTTSNYNPDALLDPLEGDLETLGVEGIHCFTFNQVEATQGWRRAVLSAAGR